MKLETKVGAFFVGTVILSGALILRMEKLELFGKSGSGREFTASFDQVAGLNPNSTVRIAGVKVGEVKDIRLVNGQALVTFFVGKDVPVYTNAQASLASIGILGEKFIDLHPGTSALGDLPTGMAMKSTPGANLDVLMKTLESVSHDIKTITASLSRSIGGEKGENRLDEILENIRQLTADVRGMARENREGLQHSIANVEQITADLRERLPRLAAEYESLGRNLNGMVDENRPEIRAITGEVRKLASGFHTTSENLRVITERLNKGEGTLGKLLTDESTVQKINTAVDNVNEMLGGLKQMEMRLDMGGAQWSKRGESQTGLTLELAPRKDYWYTLGLQSTPDGKILDSSRAVSVLDPLTGKPVNRTETTRTVTTDQSFTVSAQFARRLGDYFVVSAGMVDSRGGGGVELRLLQDRLRAGVLAYDFTKREGKDKPRVRFTTSYEFGKGLYVQAGLQDGLNRDLRTFFYGGGIRWKDDDLKKLVGLAGAGK